MFRGSIKTRVDEKGRLKLPADVKRELPEGQKFFITSEDGKWAQLYPIEEWDRKMGEMMQLPETDPTRRKFEQLTSFWGLDADMDGQGRLLLPPRLREKAKLMNEDVSITGRMLKAKSDGFPGILMLINDATYSAEMEAMAMTDEDNLKLSQHKA